MLAGARATFGRACDGKPQVASTLLDIGGVDMYALFKWFSAHPYQIRPFPLNPEILPGLLRKMRKGPVFGMGAFPSMVEQAVCDGVVDFPRDLRPDLCHS